MSEYQALVYELMDFIKAGPRSTYVDTATGILIGLQLARQQPEWAMAFLRDMERQFAGRPEGSETPSSLLDAYADFARVHPLTVEAQ